MDVRMIAHDMRTPLNALSLTLQHLKAKCGSEVGSDIDLAERNVRAVIQMVDTLLATSENGPWSKGPLVLNQCLPLDLVTSAVDQVAALAAAKSQKLATDELVALPPLVADGAKLTRVLVNLLSNAIKFAPKGGQVHVGAKHRVNDGHPGVVFSVTDNGPGVSADDVYRIFEAGVSIATDGRYSSGLGLTVCKEIVEAHEGRIWVEDTSNREGARFSFVIPMGLVPTLTAKL
jgi:signal transduction histidine kinase